MEILVPLLITLVSMTLGAFGGVWISHKYLNWAMHNHKWPFN